MTEPRPAPAPGLAIRLVGGFVLYRDGREVPAAEIGSRKARTLLRLLAVERGNRVRVDRLASVLWPDDPPSQPANNVATLVSRLRAAFGPEIVDGTRDGYRIGPAVEVDLDRAAADLAEADRRAAAGEQGIAAAVAARALRVLTDGGVLPEDVDADWARPARAEGERLLRHARLLGARTALASGAPAVARDLAAVAGDHDPYDEEACRLLMRAEAALGEPARALAAYERLRQTLADEFGVDPAADTREIHLAILQERAPAAPTATTAAAGSAPAPRPNMPVRSGFTGRDAELAALTAAWDAAALGTASLQLLTGEAGIGKTRLAMELAEQAARTGGTILPARCYEAERSLFLQPLVEAIGAYAARGGAVPLPADEAWTGPLAALVPEIARLVGHPAQRPSGEVARRQAYEAVARYLSRLAEHAPTLLSVDDLHNAGLATVELLHFLVRRCAGSRLLIVAAVRAEEGAAMIRTLDEVATRIDVGPLSGAAIARLASDAGHAGLAGAIFDRTRGHTLFVVETLRALTAAHDPGEPGIPESLRAAVLERVRRTGDGTAELLRAAAVLGSPLEPDTLSRMIDVSLSTATQRCGQAMAARLLNVEGTAYEFANDLIREVLYDAVPAPIRVSYHRRAADLSADRPEAAGAHAAAAGDWPRAATAWLVAGETAGMRGAAADARALLTRALEAAEKTDEPALAARIRLARGRAYDALVAWPAALGDFEIAVLLARDIGDRKLEVVALRELGGDTSIALAMPARQVTGHLHAGLAIAEAVGDRGTEADLLARLAVLATNRLALTDAVDYGHRAVAAARASGDPRALAAALDGQKTGFAYLGELARLAAVVAELEPLLRRQGDLWRLPWTVQESAFVPIAGERWDEALDKLMLARELNLQSGYLNNDAWFLGQIAWVHRLRGDGDRAVACAREAIVPMRDNRHPWWRTSACAQLALSLLAVGEQDEAVELLEEGRRFAVAGGGPEAFLLRCLAPLAEATGDPVVLAEADALVAGIGAPAGAAWLAGGECYLSVARARLARGEAGRAREIVTPLLAAAQRTGWTWLARSAALVLEQ